MLARLITPSQDKPQATVKILYLHYLCLELLLAPLHGVRRVDAHLPLAFALRRVDTVTGDSVRF
jgi:hypothetical protein